MDNPNPNPFSSSSWMTTTLLLLLLSLLLILDLLLDLLMQYLPISPSSSPSTILYPSQSGQLVHPSKRYVLDGSEGTRSWFRIFFLRHTLHSLWLPNPSCRTMCRASWKLRNILLRWRTSELAAAASSSRWRINMPLPLLMMMSSPTSSLSLSTVLVAASYMTIDGWMDGWIYERVDHSFNHWIVSMIIDT